LQSYPGGHSSVGVVVGVVDGVVGVVVGVVVDGGRVVGG
jgi:hypothetical protein